jgi:hypothetical protein
MDECMAWIRQSGPRRKGVLGILLVASKAKNASESLPRLV